THTHTHTHTLSHTHTLPSPASPPHAILCDRRSICQRGVRVQTMAGTLGFDYTVSLPRQPVHLCCPGSSKHQHTTCQGGGRQARWSRHDGAYFKGVITSPTGPD